MTHGLRAWQRRALDAYWAADRPPEDCLVHATPGAGKTRFAGVLARQLLDRRWVERVIVVTPTDHLRRQWAGALRALDLDLASDAANGVARLRPDAQGRPGEVLASGDGQLTVACGDGAIDLLQLQRPGGRRIDVASFLLARPTLAGRVLVAAD